MLLTVLRIVTVAFLIFYIARIYNRREASTGYIVCLALIIAGAAGNILDCLFYGLIFNNPMPPYVAITVGMAMLIFFYSGQISDVPWRKKSQLATDKEVDNSDISNN